jgi:hypothetical protein
MHLFCILADWKMSRDLAFLLDFHILKQLQLDFLAVSIFFSIFSQVLLFKVLFIRLKNYKLIYLEHLREENEGYLHASGVMSISREIRKIEVERMKSVHHGKHDNKTKPPANKPNKSYV